MAVRGCRRNTRSGTFDVEASATKVHAAEQTKLFAKAARCGPAQSKITLNRGSGSLAQALSIMRVVYTFRTGPAYYRVVIDRYYEQLSPFLRLPVQFGILSLIVATWCAWKVNPFVGALTGLLVFVVGVSATKLGLLLRFKSGADFGQDLTVTISHNGLEAKGNHVQSEWQWTAYPRSVRFPDGILLLRTDAIRWLRDAAIQDGSADQATSLVESKSTMRYIASKVIEQ